MPVNHSLSVRSLSLLTTYLADSAIVGTWPTPTDLTSYGGTSAHIFDVHISRLPPPEGGDPPLVLWQYGIRLNNALGARIHAFNINGYTRWTGGAAIQIEGKSMGVSINDGDIGLITNAVHVTGQSESIRLEDIESSDTIDAYLFDASGKGYIIANCHAGVLSGAGIKFTNGSHIVIADNFTLIAPVGIQVDHSGTGTAIVIRGNRTQGGATGIHVRGSVTQALIIGNSTPGSSASILLDTGVTYSYVISNYVFGNLPVSLHGTNQIAGSKM